MRNLILGTAYGYTTDAIAPFVKSLRRHWDGDCVLVVKSLSEKDKEFFNKFKIASVELRLDLPNPKDIQTTRYGIYKQILESNYSDVDQILITDVRDVVFQDDPFKGMSGAELEFFLEPSLFKNCTANWPWVGGIYGREGMDLVADQWVICSGTTCGKRSSMISYFKIMNEEIQRIINTGRPVYPGEDQPIHNYLVYTGRFDDFTLHKNGEGPISTMHHQHILTFDRDGRLLNNDGNPIPVVHQWDRIGPCKSVIERIALEGTPK